MIMRRRNFTNLTVRLSILDLHLVQSITLGPPVVHTGTLSFTYGKHFQFWQRYSVSFILVAIRNVNETDSSERITMNDLIR